MSTPVVVQGTAVSAPYGASPSAITTTNTANEDVSHTPSKQGCKDPIFAVLLYVNVIAIVAVAVVYGPAAFDTTTSSDADLYSGYVLTVVITAILALIFSGLGLLALMAAPEFMIKAALIFVTVMALVWCIMAFLSGNIIGGILGVIFFAFSVCYARAVWSRIPFAAVNMTTAITAIKANFGVTVVALGFTILSAGWSFLWAVALAGIFEQNPGEPNYGFLFLMFISFFFTGQVIQNSVHVSVAGTVGTWWVAPEDNGFCGKAVCNSLIRTLTTSFGSICFGSLLVAILKALKALAETARANDDAGIGACIAECILGCLASILEYFNTWAFVYVGVYGFSYLEAGKNVFTLFHNRGWEAIIADDLVGNALLMVSLVVGLIVGGFAILIESLTDWFADDSSAQITAFVLGFFVGVVVCSVFLSTIASGVNTVIVMFADAPADLERNHPRISQKMRDTWSSVYPGSV